MTTIKKLLSPFVGFDSLVDYEINIYKQHVKKVETLLQDEKREIESSFEESMQDVFSEDEAQYRIEEFGASEQYWLINDELPRIQRQGDLMGAFSFLENCLNSLCNRHTKALQVDDEHEGRNTVRKELKDVNGKGLDRAVAYLKDVARIDFPSESSAWREINSIQKIRNAFTHSEGYIGSYDIRKKRHIEDYVKKSDFLHFNGDQVVVLDGFVNYCLEQFAAFFHELINILETNYERRVETSE